MRISSRKLKLLAALALVVSVSTGALAFVILSNVLTTSMTVGGLTLSWTPPTSLIINTPTQFTATLTDLPGNPDIQGNLVFVISGPGITVGQAVLTVDTHSNMGVETFVWTQTNSSAITGTALYAMSTNVNMHEMPTPAPLTLEITMSALGPVAFVFFAASS
jgi:hypothetical protein